MPQYITTLINDGVTIPAIIYVVGILKTWFNKFPDYYNPAVWTITLVLSGLCVADAMYRGGMDLPLIWGLAAVAGVARAGNNIVVNPIAAKFSSSIATPNTNDMATEPTPPMVTTTSAKTVANIGASSLPNVIGNRTVSPVFNGEITVTKQGS